MNLDEVMKRLRGLADPASVAGMAGYGIVGQVLGVKIPQMRRLAKEIGRDRDLAAQLWAEGFRETRIVASMIDDPKALTEEQMEEWAAGFDSWEVCDQVVMNLFEKHPLAWTKAVEWSGRGEEFVKRAGFVLVARLAVSDKKAADEKFWPFFDLIEREADDGRNYVKKAVNWALRQMGKRNQNLNARAIETARRLAGRESASARWIASDALRELESEAVRARLKSK
ncbi:MAG: DNA alkylation repair protein [Deltaproteobacteria bacterium]|nr:DNA alkylation repair protein [Deltaproteobacteria bacterium]